MVNWDWLNFGYRVNTARAVCSPVSYLFIWRKTRGFLYALYHSIFPLLLQNTSIFFPSSTICLGLDKLSNVTWIFPFLFFLSLFFFTSFWIFTFNNFCHFVVIILYSYFTLIFPSIYYFCFSRVNELNIVIKWKNKNIFCNLVRPRFIFLFRTLRANLKFRIFITKVVCNNHTFFLHNIQNSQCSQSLFFRRYNCTFTRIFRKIYSSVICL